MSSTTPARVLRFPLFAGLLWMIYRRKGSVAPNPVMYAMLEGMLTWLHFIAPFTAYASFTSIPVSVTMLVFSSVIAFLFGFVEFLAKYYKLPQPSQPSIGAQVST